VQASQQAYGTDDFPSDWRITTVVRQVDLQSEPLENAAETLAALSEETCCSVRTIRSTPSQNDSAVI
jgi:hypothetical protein